MILRGPNMAIVVLIFGGLLSILGIAGYIYGFDLLPTERGVAGVISSTVLFSAGILTVGLGLVLNRLEELTKAIQGARPARPSVSESPAARPIAVATPELEPVPPPPRVVPVEPKATGTAEIEPVKIEKPRSRLDLGGALKSSAPVIAAGAAAGAVTAAVTGAARAGQDAVEKALMADTAPAPVNEPDPLEAIAAAAPVAEPAPAPEKLSTTARLDALTERLRAPLDLPKIRPLELPKLELRPKLDPVIAPPAETVDVEPVLDEKVPAAELADVVVPMEEKMPAPLARTQEVEYSVEVIEPTEPAPVEVEPEVVPEAPKTISEDPLDAFEADFGALLKTDRPTELPVAAPEEKPEAEVAPVANVPEVIEPKADTQPEVLEPEQKPAEPLVPPPPAAPAVPSPGAEVVGAYESGGAKYTMYSDGSVVAEAAGETLFFKSLEELREFIDAGVKN